MYIYIYIYIEREREREREREIVSSYNGVILQESHFSSHRFLKDLIVEKTPLNDIAFHLIT